MRHAYIEWDYNNNVIDIVIDKNNVHTIKCTNTYNPCAGAVGGHLKELEQVCKKAGVTHLTDESLNFSNMPIGEFIHRLK